MSVSKSLASIVLGVLAGRGLIDPADLVTRHLPELAGSAWDDCKLQDILDMRAGNAWEYDIDEYTILDVSDYRRARSPRGDPGRHQTWIRTIGRGRRGWRGAVPLLLAGDGRARVGARARGRRALPRASLARAVVAHRSRERRADHRSTTRASRSSRAASAPRCETSRASASCAWRTGWWRRADRPGRLDRTRARDDEELIEAFRNSTSADPNAPAPSTTTSGGCTTGREASTRGSA